MDTQTDEIKQSNVSQALINTNRGAGILAVIFRILAVFIFIGDIALTLAKIVEMSEPRYYSSPATFNIGPELFISAVFAFIFLGFASLLEMVSDMRMHLINKTDA